MIREIRSYISSVAKESITSSLEIALPYFSSEDVVGTAVDRSFGIEINDSDFNSDETIKVNVVLKTFRLAGRNALDTFDEGYCEALMIANKVIDNFNPNSALYLKSISLISTTPTKVDDSQEIYEYASSFEVITGYN